METIILGGKCVAFAGAVGTDLIFTAVRTTSTGVINGMNYIYSSDKSGIDHLKFKLDKLDLATKVRIINTFADELEEKDLPQSIKIALISVENILSKLNKELEGIGDLIKEHNEKWFAYWRSLDYSGYLSNIQAHKNVLDDRWKTLVQLLQVDKTRQLKINRNTQNTY